ncbi:MAG: GNAT family N-acetyltransferase [Actinomycetota bacterium]|nr:GNAT family N-acetyltransferase [Actinomycetota bacterium]
MPAVRRAGAGDAGALARLGKLALEDVSSRRGGVALLAEVEQPLACGEDVPSFLGSAGSAMWIASWAGADVGYAAASLVERSGEGRIGMLRCVWVEPEARGLGAGEALTQAAVDWLWHEGAGSIDAPALPGDRSAKRLLELSGFKARLIVMRRDLDQSDAPTGA